MRLARTAAEAVAEIPDGARIVVPPGLSFGPNELLEALAARTFERGVQLACSLQSLPPAVAANPRIEILIWQLFGGTRPLMAEGRASFLPLRYSEFPKVFGPGGPLEPDVLLAQLPPPAAGKISPGAAGAILLDVARTTPLVVAELSSEQPRTVSRPTLRTGDIDVAVEVQAPPPVMAVAAASADERAVAANVAALIPDGATLQFGIGGAVEAVLASLKNHRRLGVHSGMISDGVVPLVESGAVTNEAKGTFTGKTVTGLLVGGRRLLDWAEGNPDLIMAPARVTHGLRSLSRVRGLTAINSAIEVDLGGQVNAEYLRGRQYSGIGGQGDFAFAASTNDLPGNVSVVALTSTNRDGSISRIVSRLGAGTP
ncbi:MAG: acetyl-CoA hydrolase/transferase family protein, partial [Dehalococcoidia bacterium]